MKKVLIISYFYPPCNLTASQRVKGWFDYLNDNGYYPIIVTRNWDIALNSPEDASISSGDKIKHEKSANGEVYYLPYKATFRDVIFNKFRNNSFFQKISKILTFIDLLFEGVSNVFIPYNNFYSFSRKLIKEDQNIKYVLISAKPFNLFKFGYQLNKKHGIKWIADYRDDWNTSELENKKKGLMSVISFIQSKQEKKWVKSASCITSISKYYVDKISKYVGVKGNVVLNGYEYSSFEEKTVLTKNDLFIITYNGSLYPTQPIEDFLEVVKEIILDPEIKLKIQLNFPGLAFDLKQKERIEKYMKGFEENFSITARIPKNEVIKIQSESDLLLMISHSNVRGVPSSKLYEYVSLQKEILLYPDDNDIVHETLFDTGLGCICVDKKEMYDSIKKRVLAKQKQENNLFFIPNKDKIKFYSREYQAKELAKLLNDL